MDRWSEACSPPWAWCAMYKSIACPATLPTACAGCAVRRSPTTAWLSCGGKARRPTGPRAATPRPARPGASCWRTRPNSSTSRARRSGSIVKRRSTLDRGADMRRLILGLCAVAVLGGPAFAETYPARPIRLVVGYSPGGGNDLIARIVAAKLQEKLGQPVIVDHKPRAQSIVAAEAVPKAPSDGYTLRGAPSGPMTIKPAD